METPNDEFIFERREGKTIYLVRYLDGRKGDFDFSFDKKTIYNLFSEWDKLTDEQKALLRKEYPVMAALKE